MSKTHERGTIHVPPSETPRAIRAFGTGGHHIPVRPVPPTALTDAQIAEDFLEAFTPPVEPVTDSPAPKTSDGALSGQTTRISPEIGSTNPEDFRQKEEQWRTLGADAWFYDSPIWDPRRIRLGRIDKPTKVKLIQELTGPKRRLAQEVERSYEGSDGKIYTKRFWVHPKRGGYDGMPKNPNSQGTLGLTKQIKTPQT